MSQTLNEYAIKRKAALEHAKYIKEERDLGETYTFQPQVGRCIF